jgi:hypothetical protein
MRLTAVRYISKYSGIVLFICFAYVIPCAAQDKTPPPKNGDSCEIQRMSPISGLQQYSKRKNLLAKLLRSILVQENNDQASKKQNLKPSEKRYTNYQNKIIRHIDIIVLGPFGYNVSETYAHRINWFQKTGDKLHYNTREWVVRDKLLFREGDTANAFKIAESERLLRSNNYIYDSRINVTPIAHSDSVDVMVVVQDVFDLSGGAAGDPFHQNGNVSVSDINFLGLGHRINAVIGYDPTLTYKWTVNSQYIVNQIGNTYITAEMHYKRLNYYEDYGFSVSRGFYSTNVHWAGGYAMDFVQEPYAFLSADTVRHAGVHNYNQQDAWIGYAFNPDIRNGSIKQKAQIITSARVLRRQYMQYNSDSFDVVQRYHNDVLVLGAVGYSFRNYYRDRYIFGFGRSEDIPLGYLFVLTGGMDFASIYTRPYFGAKASYGMNSENLGYLFLDLEGGAYIQNREAKEGVISAQALYFTNVIPAGDWKIRQYLWNRFTIGINRFPDEFINIDGGQGIRTFNSPLAYGTQKFVANYEADFFTPFRPLGFQMVGVVYVDEGLVGTNRSPLYRSLLYQGYGIGIRMKNEHLIFNAIELSFHYFPNSNLTDARSFMFYTTARSFYTFQDFQFAEPYQIGYQ